MKEFKADVFAAVTNWDLNAGSLGERILGYFTEPEDATQAAKGKGVQGTNGSVEKRSLRVVVYETLEEYKQDCAKSAKKSALSKLTHDEMAALGLKPDDFK